MVACVVNTSSQAFIHELTATHLLLGEVSELGESRGEVVEKVHGILLLADAIAARA
jgi:hypothetical protein